MLVNYFIPPHPLLAAFIDNYLLSTSGNDIISLNGYWPASNESSLVFYIAEKPQHHETDNSDSILSGKDNYLVGLLTRHNGFINFKGRYHTFVIQFKANGIHKIFRMAMNEFIDKIFTVDEIFGKQAKCLREQLMNTDDIQQMAHFADLFLLSFLGKHKKTTILNDGVTAISKELYNTTNLLNVAQYADKANMSVRNFERRFIEQVGISPKLYTKLVRFNEVVKIKLMQPAKNWTSIAYECNYYDQMHLIKDFKQFTNFSPTEYFSEELPKEKFVFVKRLSF